MQSLILNTRWKPGPDGSPKHFQISGPVSYDNYAHNGCRTCSVTLPETSEAMACLTYSEPLSVQGEKRLSWGCRIRAIEAQDVSLVTNFYDAQGNLIESSQSSIAPKITDQFRRLLSSFRVPAQATSARIAIQLTGKVTACTLCDPCAYFM